MIPGKWGRFFHNYERDHRRRCRLCTFAKASASFPSPWALRKIPRPHKNLQWNSQGHGVQQKSAMAASACLQLQDSVRWSGTALTLPSNHVLCLLHRIGTYHNLSSTCMKLKIFLFSFHFSFFANRGIWDSLTKTWLCSQQEHRTSSRPKRHIHHLNPSCYRKIPNRANHVHDYHCRLKGSLAHAATENTQKNDFVQKNSKATLQPCKAQLKQ